MPFIVFKRGEKELRATRAEWRTRQTPHPPLPRRRAAERGGPEGKDLPLDADDSVASLAKSRLRSG
jgi:hypothetical protein